MGATDGDNLAVVARDLIRLASAGGGSPSAYDVLDLLWLASEFPVGALFKPVAQDAVERKETRDARGPSDQRPRRDEPSPDARQSIPSRERARSHVDLMLPSSDPLSAAGRPVVVPAPPALRGQRALLNALRPVMVRGPSRTRSRLDADATVRRAAEESLYELVQVPVRERLVDAVLLLDYGTSMDMWRPVMRDLSRVLRFSGGFRRLTVGCVTRRDGAPLVVAPADVARPSPRPLDLEPLAPSLPRLTLIVTDCVSGHWRERAWLSKLDEWSDAGYVAILQVLPESLWQRTALASATAVAAPTRQWLPRCHHARRRRARKGAAPGLASRIAAAAGKGAADNPPAGLFPAAPLFRPAGLRHVARFLAGRPDAPSNCYLFSPPRERSSTAGAAPPDPLKALDAFRLRASRAARRLATLLATSAVISLPVARIIQETQMRGQGGPLVEAELWLSGLLEPLEESKSEDPEDALYTYRPGVRSALLDGVSSGLAMQILLTTSEYVEQNLPYRAQLAGFRAVIADPAAHPGAIRAGRGGDPIARITAEILRNKLGGVAARVVDAGDDAGGPADLAARRRPGEQFKYDSRIHRFAWSHDGTRLAVPTRGGILFVTSDSEERRLPVTPGMGLNEVSWSPDGRLVAVACIARIIHVVDERLNFVTSLLGHRSDATAVAFSPDGRHLASGTAGGTLRLWWVDDWRLLGAVSRDRDAVRCLCWVDNRTIVVGYGGVTDVVGVDGGRLRVLRTLRAGARSVAVVTPPATAAWLARGRVLAVGQVNGQISFFDPETGQLLTAVTPARSQIGGLSASSDGALLAARSRDGDVAVISLATGRIEAAFHRPGKPSPYGTVAFRPGTRDLAVAEADDREIHRYDVSEFAAREEGRPSRPLRVRVFGSDWPSKGASPSPEFEAACRAIGRALALRGHVPVISSFAPTTADRQVAEGYLSVDRVGEVVLVPLLSEQTQLAQFEQLLPQPAVVRDAAALSELAQGLSGPLARSNIPAAAEHLLHYVIRVARRDDWLIPCLEAIGGWLGGEIAEVIDRELRRTILRVVRTPATAPHPLPLDAEAVRLDCVLLVGGHERTHESYEAAGRLGLPVVCVPNCGGTASQVWRRVSKQLVDSGVRPSVANALDQPWGDGSAERVIDVIEEASRAAGGRRSPRDDDFQPLLPRRYSNHVLWVDDRPTNNITERAAMEPFGFRFTLAGSTREAMDAVAREAFGCIISGMGRREGSREGYVLLDAIRARKIATPFVIYARSAAPEHQRESLARGAQGCTNRPDELFELVMRSICRRPSPNAPSASSSPAIEPPLTGSMAIEAAIDVRDPSIAHGPWVTSIPQHRLNPTPEFCIGLYPVRNTDFWHFVRAGGYDDPSNWDRDAPRGSFMCADRTPGPGSWRSGGVPAKEIERHPVAGVSFYEARAYCRWLNKVAPRDGWTWALPTDNMWEFTARCRRREAPTVYPWGNHYERGLCNSAEEALSGTSDVGRFPRGATADGCLDLAGNVWEFVDRSAADELCALRGGSFLNNQFEVQSLLRLHGVARSQRAPDFGFRCACIRNASGGSHRPRERERADAPKSSRKRKSSNRTAKK